jgi:hypothetical protein
MHLAVFLLPYFILSTFKNNEEDLGAAKASETNDMWTCSSEVSTFLTISK